MRRRTVNARVRAWLSGGPTVGNLMELCERNFTLLGRLSPDLAVMAGAYRSVVPGAAALQLDVLEQNRYTTVVRLTHVFAGDGCHDPDPDARVRIYHDARQAEVVELRQSVLPVAGLYDHPGLQQKWRANLFLGRWLQFCIVQGHSFTNAEPERRRHDTVAEPVPA